MIPKYCYLVRTTYMIGTNNQRQETKSFLSLGTAVSYRDNQINRPSVRRVEVLMLLDEHVRGEQPDNNS